MEGEEASKSSTSPSFRRIFVALSTSMGMLFQFVIPFDKALGYNYNPTSVMATLTFYLGMTMLLICFAKGTTKPLNPTSARWIHYLGTAAVAACFTTLVLGVLPEACTVFTNPTLFSPQTVSWASEWGLILLAITVAYKLISEIPTSWFQQHCKVVFFDLCVAITGAYMEPSSSITSTINFSSVICKTISIHHFGLVPCTFVLAVLLLILGVAFPDSSTGHTVSFMFKEFVATLALSVGCVTLLIGASFTVCASVFSSAMVGGVEDAGKAIQFGAI